MFWTRAILWKIIKVLGYLIGMVRYYPARKKKYFFCPILDTSTYATPYVLHKAGKQEYEPKGFTVYHGAFKHQYHDELVCSCVHRYGKIRGSASNRIKVFTTILTTFDRKNIRS